MKFGRIYELVVQGVNGVHTFRLPTTIRFDITRSLREGNNSARISINNVNPNSRKDIYLDRLTGYKEYRGVRLRAGYASETSMPLIFRGNAVTEYSERQGSEIITHIDAHDGLFAVANSFYSGSQPAGWSYVSVVEEVMKSMKNVSPGTITPQSVQNNRGIAFNGASWAILQSLAATNANELFIDNEIVNILTKNSTITVESPTLPLTSATGLIGIPRIAGNLTMVTMLFEPNLKIGSPLELRSDFNRAANGRYKVLGFHHYGTISGVDSGSAYTDLTLGKFGSVVANI